MLQVNSATPGTDHMVLANRVQIRANGRFRINYTDPASSRGGQIGGRNININGWIFW